MPAQDADPPSEIAASVLAVARGVALFLGAFALLNVASEANSTGLDANLWWIDLRPCPPRIARALMAVSGVWLVLFAVRPAMPRPIRWVGGLVLATLMAAALQNIAGHFTLVRAGIIRSDVAVPFAAHVAACLAVVAAGLCVRTDAPVLPRHAFASALTTLVCLVAFPLGQMHCFGKIDHRREADAVVVFGCGVFPDGTPSEALIDRVKTACGLYSSGMVDWVMVSGGPGEGSVHETDAMKRIALDAGVPESRIVVDRDGLDTAATVRRVVPQLRGRACERVLAVSHYYHLPRVKLAFRRAGVEVSTVPAVQSRPLARMPRHLARETAALWAYWFLPITGGRGNAPSAAEGEIDADPLPGVAPDAPAEPRRLEDRPREPLDGDGAVRRSDVRRPVDQHRQEV